LIALSYFKTFGSDIIIPRSYNAYGPGQPLNWGAVIPKTINKILNGDQPVIFKDGKQTRDFVFVKDIVRAIIEITKKAESGLVVNIGTGVETPITDLVHTICRLMNYQGEVKYEEQRVADVSRHKADIDLLTSLTGFVPRVKLEEGLRETIDYYISIHSNKTVRL
jgi:UDP-glucose 4-epimerase